MNPVRRLIQRPRPIHRVPYTTPDIETLTRAASGRPTRPTGSEVATSSPSGIDGSGGRTTRHIPERLGPRGPIGIERLGGLVATTLRRTLLPLLLVLPLLLILAALLFLWIHDSPLDALVQVAR